MTHRPEPIAGVGATSCPEQPRPTPLPHPWRPPNPMTQLERDYRAYTLLWQRRHPGEPPLPFQAYVELWAERDELQRMEREINHRRALVQERLGI